MTGISHGELHKRRSLSHLKLLSQRKSAVEVCAPQPIEIPVIDQTAEPDVYAGHASRSGVIPIFLQFRHKARSIEFHEGKLHLVEAAVYVYIRGDACQLH